MPKAEPGCRCSSSVMDSPPIRTGAISVLRPQVRRAGLCVGGLQFLAQRHGAGVEEVHELEKFSRNTIGKELEAEISASSAARVGEDPILEDRISSATRGEECRYFLESFPIVLRENFSSSLNLFDPGPMPLCEKLKTADAKPSPRTCGRSTEMAPSPYGR